MKYILITLSIIITFWTLLTYYVEQPGPAKAWYLDSTYHAKKILIVFDPDPIYNLDEQVCLSFGKGLVNKNIGVTVVTVAAVDQINLNSFDGYVLCANTYNWSPDWAIVNLVESSNFIKAKPVIAITLGSGSTQQSQSAFENILVEQGGILIHSTSMWLMRPNDEERMEYDNVEVAKSIAYQKGMQLADSILTSR